MEYWETVEQVLCVQLFKSCAWNLTWLGKVVRELLDERQGDENVLAFFSLNLLRNFFSFPRNFLPGIIILTFVKDNVEFVRFYNTFDCSWSSGKIYFGYNWYSCDFARVHWTCFVHCIFCQNHSILTIFWSESINYSFFISFLWFSQSWQIDLIKKIT